MVVKRRPSARSKVSASDSTVTALTCPLFAALRNSENGAAGGSPAEVYRATANAPMARTTTRTPASIQNSRVRGNLPASTVQPLTAEQALAPRGDFGPIFVEERASGRRWVNRRTVA